MGVDKKYKVTSMATNDEDASEYAHAEYMFIYEMAIIRSLIARRRRPERLGFEIGIAYTYYTQIIPSGHLTSKKNPNSKMVLAACKEYDKYLDNILPLRRILKKVD
jgi:hypothetical protein